jgi:hypothetical protein
MRLEFPRTCDNLSRGRRKHRCFYIFHMWPPTVYLVLEYEVFLRHLSLDGTESSVHRAPCPPDQETTCRHCEYSVYRGSCSEATTAARRFSMWTKMMHQTDYPPCFIRGDPWIGARGGRANESYELEHQNDVPGRDGKMSMSKIETSRRFLCNGYGAMSRST